jgi:hypothetical protein
MAEELHVLFGGGQVGHPLSRILLGCGKRVRIVKRSAGGLPDGHCIHPPYYARVWAELLPRSMAVGETAQSVEGRDNGDHAAAHSHPARDRRIISTARSALTRFFRRPNQHVLLAPASRLNRVPGPPGIRIHSVRC